MLSKIYLPFKKAVWFGEISLSAQGLNLLVQALEKILKLQLVKAIGLYFFNEVASGSFGMRVSMEKFNLNIAAELLSNSLAKLIKSVLISSQNFW